MKSVGGSYGKGGGLENGVKAGGESDTTNNMGVQGVSVGNDGDSAVGKRGGSSTMASYLPGGKEGNRWAVLW